MESRNVVLAIAAALMLAPPAGCKPKAQPGKAGEEAPAPAEETAAAGEESGEEEAGEQEAEPAASGKKAVMIIACKDFRDEELAEPRRILEEAGVSVTVASTSKEGCKGMLGAEVTPDVLVGDLKADDFDLAVFVGGTGSAAYYTDETVLEFAREADEEGLVIGAICLAPGILAKAGVLEGIKATSYDAESARKAFEEGGATWTGEKVTVDGVFVTGNGPDAVREFGEKLVEVLK